MRSIALLGKSRHKYNLPTTKEKDVYSVLRFETVNEEERVFNLKCKVLYLMSQLSVFKGNLGI